MGTLSRYLLLRTTGRFALLLVVFLGVIAGGQIALALGRGVPPDALGPALLGMILLAMPLALPMALTTAVLLTMGALQRDGELRALASVGIPETAVAARLAPLVVAGVLASALLSHVVLPQAMISFRENSGRFGQAVLAFRVAAKSSLFSEQGTRVYARSAEGRTLEDIHLVATDKDSRTGIHAREANWYFGRSDRGEGIGLELRDVTMIRRYDDGRVTLAETPQLAYPVLNRTARKGVDASEDTWSTPRLIATIDAWQAGDDHELLNNARLNLHLRLFLPLAVVIFTIFAAGLALALGTADLLVGVVIVVLLVATSTVPAMQYVKSDVDIAQIHPAWLLWPPALALLASGLWMIARPDRARERLAMPLGLAARAMALVRQGVRVAYLHAVVRRRRQQQAISGLADQAAPAAAAVLPRALGVLDRHILVRAITRWLAVLFLGTFLICLGEFVGKSNVYIGELGKRPLLVVQFFLYRMPEFASMWLPASLALAGLLVAAPMLRQGTIVALSAAGVAPRRVFAALVPFALLVGVFGFVLDDQIVPRLRPLGDDAFELLNSGRKDTLGSVQGAGWRTGPAFWSARSAKPGLGEYSQVAIYDGRPGKPKAAFADALVATPDGWQMRNVTVVSASSVRRLAACTPAEAGFELPLSRKLLALELRSDDTKTSRDLIRSPGSRGLGLILARFIWILAPISCLAMALPLFTRWESRLQLGSTGAKAACLLVAPLLVLGLATRVLGAGASDPLLVAGVVLAVLGGATAWRFARMQV